MKKACIDDTLADIMIAHGGDVTATVDTTVLVGTSQAYTHTRTHTHTQISLKKVTISNHNHSYSCLIEKVRYRD